MLVVRIEMWPKGDHTMARSLGIASIENVRGGSLAVGHYLARLFKAPEYSKQAEKRPLFKMLTQPLQREVWRQGEVRDFDRQRLGPWDLLFRALGELVANRSPDVQYGELGHDPEFDALFHGDETP